MLWHAKMKKFQLKFEFRKEKKLKLKNNSFLLNNR